MRTVVLYTFDTHLSSDFLKIFEKIFLANKHNKIDKKINVWYHINNMKKESFL